ncbi:MAG: hypothetical protein G01um101425_771 [Candidatus Peregrinibacteria bacterium Gr01-1014_25]|nr:MAG: hypothetical protein G01um101425_771 [Candidatus Peregrinibacteria bacterium Gr01-1014_25]
MIDHEKSFEKQPQVTVRAMISSDVPKIQRDVNADFTPEVVLKLMTVAFVAMAGDRTVGYMVYRLDKGKAVIRQCVTHPEFRHATYDMMIGLMTGGVMEEVRRKWADVFNAQPEAEPADEMGAVIQDTIRLHQKLKQLVPSAFSGIRKKDHITMDIASNDPLRPILEELGFNPAEGTDGKTLRMEYKAEK